MRYLSTFVLGRSGCLRRDEIGGWYGIMGRVDKVAYRANVELFLHCAIGGWLPAGDFARNQGSGRRHPSPHVAAQESLEQRHVCSGGMGKERRLKNGTDELILPLKLSKGWGEPHSAVKACFVFSANAFRA